MVPIGDDVLPCDVCGREVFDEAEKVSDGLAVGAPGLLGDGLVDEAVGQFRLEAVRVGCTSRPYDPARSFDGWGAIEPCWRQRIRRFCLLHMPRMSAARRRTLCPAAFGHALAAEAASPSAGRCLLRKRAT